MITYIRSVDKWKIKPTPQTIPCCRIKKRNILANQTIFYVDKRCVYIRILSTQPATYRHSCVNNAIFVLSVRNSS